METFPRKILKADDYRSTKIRGEYNFFPSPVKNNLVDGLVKRSALGNKLNNGQASCTKGFDLVYLESLGWTTIQQFLCNFLVWYFPELLVRNMLKA